MSEDDRPGTSGSQRRSQRQKKVRLGVHKSGRGARARSVHSVAWNDGDEGPAEHVENVNRRTIDMISDSSTNIFEKRGSRSQGTGATSEPKRNMSLVSRTTLVSMLGESFFQHKPREDIDGERLPASSSSRNPNLTKGGVFIYMVLPPDGGYGWFVMIISFLCHVIIDGILLTVGMLLPAIAAEFQLNDTEVVLVTAVQVGPIASAHINKYGFRQVALAGAVLGMSVMAISYFSPNIMFLVAIYSVFGGVALSMIWASSQLIIGYYFEKYRPIANGIAVSGNGAGIMIFSLFNPQICQAYGWRMNLLLYIVLLFLVFCMAWAYVEVKPTQIGQTSEQAPIIDSDDEYGFPTNTERTESIVKTSTYIDEASTVSDDNQPQPSLERRVVPGEGASVQPEAESKHRFRHLLYQLCPMCLRHEDREHGDQKIDETHTLEKHFLIERDPMDRRDLFYTGPADYSGEDLYEQRSSIDGQQLEFLGDQKNIAKSQYNISMIPAPDAGKFAPKKKDKLTTAIRTLFDLELLKKWEFRILLTSAFLFLMGFNIPFVYSKLRAELNKEQAALITPTIGLSAFVARITSGFIAFRFKEYTPIICGTGITIGGLAVLSSAFYGERAFWFQILYAICYAIAPAFYSSLRAIIYVRYLGLQKLTNAFGLTALAMGIGVFTGTTTAAALIQYTDSYQPAFIFSGLCIITSGMLKLLLPIFKRVRNPIMNLCCGRMFTIPSATYTRR